MMFIFCLLFSRFIKMTNDDGCVKVVLSIEDMFDACMKVNWLPGMEEVLKQ